MPAPLKLGLIGYPLAHSLSPRLFACLARLTRRAISYRAIAVPPRRLSPAVWKGLDGFNVTIPHKTAVIPLLDELTPEARAIGAVNCVFRRGGRLVGDNTDAAGFADAVRGAEGPARFHPEDQTAVVLGAGGAARAVGYALGQMGARRVWFSTRRTEQACAVVALLAPRFPKTVFGVGRPRRAELYVNATPLGMEGFPSLSPAVDLPGCREAVDLVYRRDGALTPFLEVVVLGYGRPALDGLPMLVYQALRGWERWTKPLTAARRRALKSAIIEELCPSAS